VRDHLTPLTFQADVMNFVRPLAAENGERETSLFTQHKGKVFLYNPQCHRLADRVLHQAARENGNPVRRRLRDHADPLATLPDRREAEVNA